MRLETVLSLAGVLVLLSGGCSGALHQVPQATPDQISATENEVLAGPDLEKRRPMSADEASRTFASVVERIHPAAQSVCHEINAGNCRWRYRMANDRSLNAYATADGLVVLNRGLAELSANDDEIAMVLSHELAHHSANHPRNTMNNVRIGGLLGAVLGSALDVAAAAGGARTGGDLGRYGAALGVTAGQLSYSKDQEREADYLGVLIAYRAGVDLDKARGIMVTMARMSGKQESSLLDTHPAGAERLAGFDRAVAEVRASNGALPSRKK